MYRDGYGNGVSREIAVRFGWIYRTDIETGEYLLRCLLYVDLNMVRAGVVSYPEQWRHGESNEIQHPRRKNILIDYETLSRLSGFDNFESFQSAHGRWVQSALSDYHSDHLISNVSRKREFDEKIQG